MQTLKFTFTNTKVIGKISEFDIKETGEHARDIGDGFIDVFHPNGSWSIKYQPVVREITDDGGNVTEKIIDGYIKV